MNTVASLLILVLLSSPIMLSVSFGFAKVADLPSAYIRSDGTVEGTSSIQRSGDVYTFVGNSKGALYIEKDNIVIDGAGYTLVGGRSRGIVLADRHGVTLKNARVEVDNGHIVDMSNTRDCVLIGNTFVGTPKPIPDLPPPAKLLGPIAVHMLNSQRITVKDNFFVNFFFALALDCSSGHTITGNTFTDGILGIELSNTTDCVFRNNRMTNSTFSTSVFRGYGYENDLDASNTIDGKPIYYWVNHKDEAVPQDAAYVVLVNCENIKAENLIPKGITLVSTTNSDISRVKLVGNGDGIALLDCSGITIADSILHDHAVGLHLEGSSDCTISHNEFSNYMTSGIRFVAGKNNTISGNTFFNNSKAIAPVHDSVPVEFTVSLNNFTGNDWAITVHGNMKIQDNVFNDNEYAIGFSSGSGSTVTKNIFTNNENALYFSDSSNNNIYLNNFKDNAHHFTDAGVNNQTSLLSTVETSSNSIGSVKPVTVHSSGVNFFPPPPPSTNNWDDGAKGNYWSDYTGSDSNGDGIGDTAYHLYENNQDHFPLMEPVAVSEVPSAPAEPASQSPEDTESTDDAQGSEGTGGAILPVEYVVAAIATVIGVAVVGAFFLKGRKVTA